MFALRKVSTFESRVRVEDNNIILDGIDYFIYDFDKCSVESGRGGTYPLEDCINVTLSHNVYFIEDFVRGSYFFRHKDLLIWYKDMEMYLWHKNKLYANVKYGGITRPLTTEFQNSFVNILYFVHMKDDRLVYIDSFGSTTDFDLSFKDCIDMSKSEFIRKIII